MKNAHLKLENISKKYILHHEKPTLVENILSGRNKEEFWALKDINLTIKPGESVGIIGPNGSGKTTLLEIISGIVKPTSGNVQAQGKVISLIELSAGFHPDLTGEENIHLNGLLIGMSATQIRQNKPAIIKFAGLGKFIDAPFYTYSSGMALRLGFSIAIHAEPDILVLDENLTVGDQDFKEKSYQKIHQYIEAKKTVIIASHHLKLIDESCDRVIWLDNATIKKMGPTKKITQEYKSQLKN